MATNYFKAIHRPNYPPVWRRNNISTSTGGSFFLKPTSTGGSFFLKPTTTSTINISTSLIPFSLSSSTASSTNPTSLSTSQTISFNLLRQHLSSQNFRQADEETRRLLILLAGEASEKRGYVFFSEVQFISEDDLQTVDKLWRNYSNNRFGYSVQKPIWNKVGRDFTKFFVKIGWMKKLETEVVQYNYRDFPEEFIWEMNEETPQGHLPLTNALRGTQLFSSILTHPAFGRHGEEIADDDDYGNDLTGGGNGGLVSGEW